jgi:hypothetical protein
VCLSDVCVSLWVAAWVCVSVPRTLSDFGRDIRCVCVHLPPSLCLCECRGGTRGHIYSPDMFSGDTGAARTARGHTPPVADDGGIDEARSGSRGKRSESASPTASARMRKPFAVHVGATKVAPVPVPSSAAGSAAGSASGSAASPSFLERVAASRLKPSDSTAATLGWVSPLHASDRDVVGDGDCGDSVLVAVDASSRVRSHSHSRGGAGAKGTKGDVRRRVLDTSPFAQPVPAFVR